MAHHQGMSLLSLAYLLLDRPMQRRFESDPSFQATTLLLQERVLRATRFRLQTAELSDLQKSSDYSEAPMRIFNSSDSPTPCIRPSATFSFRPRLWPQSRRSFAIAGPVP
jgi:hypothetical protein